MREQDAEFEEAQLADIMRLSKKGAESPQPLGDKGDAPSGSDAPIEPVLNYGSPRTFTYSSY